MAQGWKQGGLRRGAWNAVVSAPSAQPLPAWLPAARWRGLGLPAHRSRAAPRCLPAQTSSVPPPRGPAASAAASAGATRSGTSRGDPSPDCVLGKSIRGLCRATGGAGSALRTHLFQQHLEPPGHVGVRDTVGHFQLAVGGQASCRARLRNHPAVGLLHPAVSPVAQAAAGDPVAGASAACRRGERGRARLESLPCRVSGLCTAPEHRDAGSVNTPGWCRVLPKGNTGGEDLGLWAGVAGPAAAAGSAGPVAGPTPDPRRWNSHWAGWGHCAVPSFRMRLMHPSASNKAPGARWRLSRSPYPTTPTGLGHWWETCKLRPVLIARCEGGPTCFGRSFKGSHSC